MAKKKATKEEMVTRPPVVVVMGHIDHGKSTLLDYIRESNVVDGEAGGITQHLSAYVVDHTPKEGAAQKITFLDTPGHAAFQKMRFRGADVADIAILIVSAEDGVKPQTLEALECIKKAEIPYIVAINKIDKPAANLVKTQSSLIENEIYIEGMGGDISWVAISAKSGEGIPELLDLLLLTAEMAELTGDKNADASGTIIEGYLDDKRGNTATLIVKNGCLKNGAFVVSGCTYAPTRMLEDWNGKSIKEVGLSEPVGVIGFNAIPEVGADFYTVSNKKEAEKAITAANNGACAQTATNSNLPTIPLLIKADALGTIEAIQHELDKFESDRIAVRVISSGVGDVTVGDVQNVSATENAIIVGFGVKVERSATDLAERLGVEIDTFDIIYDLAEWLEKALKNRTPQKEEAVTKGRAKVLKHFSTQKDVHVIGGRVDEGSLSVGNQVRILRRDIEVGTGVIKNIQQQKNDVQSVNTDEFGMQVSTKHDIAAGDYLEAFAIEIT
ncbi:MAG: translation initiation factor IF-2 [Candidatus Pacebacteria bacterium]|nr:translation initiation factor IF-2 [Candidatus Paceibacterota bacterium]